MKTYEINDIELHQLILKASDMGATNALIKAGVINPLISETEAFRIHGRNSINLWNKMGLISPIQKGYKAKKQYSVEQLNAAALSEKRHLYMTVKERKDAD